MASCPVWSCLKLREYKGNESALYHELKSGSKLKFRFPDPSFLEGVKSKGRALLKMRVVGFTYPNTTRTILCVFGARCRCGSQRCR